HQQKRVIDIRGGGEDRRAVAALPVIVHNTSDPDVIASGEVCEFREHDLRPVAEDDNDLSDTGVAAIPDGPLEQRDPSDFGERLWPGVLGITESAALARGKNDGLGCWARRWGGLKRSLGARDGRVKIAIVLQHAV